ncbi:hypothetical protein [Catenuloplanes indicus]|uniref:Uncharacterized protein n=1 Tax=Catenuloplanes indicus TaxID=137267 RepID=A0AAE4B1K1_9ACTN|nr:hypothetical protein [Catenuloplanes indicus]MDQ0370729.1 hypothetical protein [Catenuloplanes indicus]
MRRGFPFRRLRTLTTVTTLRLNGVQTELDRADVAAMPALLDAPGLRSLTMVDCGRAGAALRGVTDRFRAHGFDRLDIHYA